MSEVLGTCSCCGGPVVNKKHGKHEAPTCEACGAVKREAFGPIIDMQPPVQRPVPVMPFPHLPAPQPLPVTPNPFRENPWREPPRNPFTDNRREFWYGQNSDGAGRQGTLIRAKNTWVLKLD